MSRFVFPADCELASRIVRFFRSRARSNAKQKVKAAALALTKLPFVSAEGLGYEDFFRHLHKTFLFDWYLEIGCRTGSIFSDVRGRTIAIDPYFLVTTNVIGPKPELHVFQATSDDFFASEFLERNKIALSVSFLDGMHLFEYLLRDFINTERNSHPDGVIMLHDCCPYTNAMTTRDFDTMPKGPWTGDVWKLLPIFRHYRPDLKVTVLNCATTGVVLVSGLAPGNDVLSVNYDAIVKGYRDIDMETFGIAEFYSSFTYTDAQAFLDAGAPMFSKIALRSDQALTPVFITP